MAIDFCENCRDEIEYSIVETTETRIVKGKELTYPVKLAYCNECGQEIDVHEICDYNLQMQDKAYREREGIIKVSEIEEILTKYNIGKRPLSLLLGWGEGTVTKYLEGSMPTKQYSDILEIIRDYPLNLANLLEKNKDRISSHAYDQCKEALKRIKDQSDLKMAANEGKIDSVVKYLLIHCVEITPLALQKLLYYAQGFYKAFFGKYLFADNCEAWVHGPVYRDIYFAYKDRGCNPIEENFSLFSNIELTSSETKMLDSIIATFGCYSGKVLEKMTHRENPWSFAREGLEDNDLSERTISKESIAEYFEMVKAKYNMLNISDIKDYSSDMFEKFV